MSGPAVIAFASLCGASASALHALARTYDRERPHRKVREITRGALALQGLAGGATACLMASAVVAYAQMNS